MGVAKDDTDPVTWGDLRKALDLAVTLASEVSVYTSLSVTGNASADEHFEKIKDLGRELNTFVQGEIVKGASAD